MNKELPIFLQNPRVRGIFEDVAKSVPRGTRFYIVGGAMRNVMYYKYFHKRFPQRDYDSVIIGNHVKFISNLRKAGFIYGKIRRKRQLVLKKRKFKGAKRIEDFVVLDIHWERKGSILENLKQRASFTINGFAIEVRDLFSPEWHWQCLERLGI